MQAEQAKPAYSGGTEQEGELEGVIG